MKNNWHHTNHLLNVNAIKTVLTNKRNFSVKSSKSGFNIQSMDYDTDYCEITSKM